MQRPADVNDSQWRAITDVSKHLLIVAGPGTGKTHTLIYRIRQFVPHLREGQKILAITFTNKAGQEISERLSRTLSGTMNVITSGTFHYFCLKILREYFSDRLPADFRVPLVQERADLAQEVWPQLNASLRRDLLESISLRKAKDFSLTILPEALEYDSAMRRRRWLDFDDLLLETVRFLTAQTDICERVRQQYPFVFVDEYQDINPIQQRLLKLLVGESGRITAIGDPHQAIYGFRGSDVKYFTTFVADFVGAAVLTLAENYRAARNLLSASNQIMATQSVSLVPELTTHIYSPGRLVIQQSPTDKAEAEYVVHQIEKMVGGTSFFSRNSGRVDNDEPSACSFDDIAILFRLNSQRALLEEALDRSGIPYQIFQERDYEDPEEKKVKAFKHANSDERAGDKVSLMTLHASKGLEFSVVFIVGCEENLLPLNFQNLKSDPQEERRLFYVGVTRAKEKLFLVCAAKRRLYGQTYETAPSPFLADIQEHLKEYDRAQERKRPKPDQQMMLFP